MNEISRQLKKIEKKSNGKMRVVDVLKERIPNFESIVKLDNEILAQVGERNIAYKNIINEKNINNEKKLVKKGRIN